LIVGHIFPMETLHDILLDLGEFKSYFGGKVPVDLWRAQRKREQGHPVFRPILEEKQVGVGRVRLPDIATEMRDGVRYVLCAKRPRGISTFDRPFVFPRDDWNYFRIPKGTDIPTGLAIVKDFFNSAYGATHYTIAPAYDMPEANFISLLDILARNATLEVRRAAYGRA